MRQNDTNYKIIFVHVYWVEEYKVPFKICLLIPLSFYKSGADDFKSFSHEYQNTLKMKDL